MQSPQSAAAVARAGRISRAVISICDVTRLRGGSPQTVITVKGRHVRLQFAWIELSMTSAWNKDPHGAEDGGATDNRAHSLCCESDVVIQLTKCSVPLMHPSVCESTALHCCTSHSCSSLMRNIVKLVTVSSELTYETKLWGSVGIEKCYFYFLNHGRHLRTLHWSYRTILGFVWRYKFSLPYFLSFRYLFTLYNASLFGVMRLTTQFVIESQSSSLLDHSTCIRWKFETWHINDSGRIVVRDAVNSDFQAASAWGGHRLLQRLMSRPYDTCVGHSHTTRCRRRYLYPSLLPQSHS